MNAPQRNGARPSHRGHALGAARPTGVERQLQDALREEARAATAAGAPVDASALYDGMARADRAARLRVLGAVGGVLALVGAFMFTGGGSTVLDREQVSATLSGSSGRVGAPAAAAPSDPTPQSSSVGAPSPTDAVPSTAPADPGAADALAALQAAAEQAGSPVPEGARPPGATAPPAARPDIQSSTGMGDVPAPPPPPPPPPPAPATTAPPTTTTAPQPAPVAFTANQTIGVRNGLNPYDDFWGTATPGTVVRLTSPFTSTEVVAGATGTWSARVTFPHAPIGITFHVKVRWGGEVRAEFPFTRTA